MEQKNILDGVGYNWIDELIDYCTQVTEEQLAAIEFPYNPPATKEFRSIFNKLSRQLLHKQLEMDSKMARKFGSKWKSKMHTCKQILKLQKTRAFLTHYFFCFR
jgi:asparagine synthase (glutamine-hydrolysing)